MMIERTPYARKREQYYQQNPYSYNNGSDQLANAGSNILDGNRPQRNMYGNKSEEEIIRERQAKQNYARELEKQMKEVQERKRREKAEQEEYDRKLDESIRNYNPYGKEGGGAPLRDENGNLRANLAIRSPTKSPSPKPQLYSTLRRNEESPPNYLPRDIPPSNNNQYNNYQQQQQLQLQPIQPMNNNNNNNNSIIPLSSSAAVAAPNVYSRQPLLPSYYYGNNNNIMRGVGVGGSAMIPYSQHAIMLYQQQQANRMMNYQLHNEIQELRSEFTLEHDSIKHEIDQQNELITKIQRDLEELQRERDREKVKSFVLPSVKSSPIIQNNNNNNNQQQQHSLFSYPEISSINTNTNTINNNNNNNSLLVQLKPPHLPPSIFDNPYSSIQQQQPQTVEASTSPAFPISNTSSPIPFISSSYNNNNNNEINLLSPPNTYQLQQQLQDHHHQQQQLVQQQQQQHRLRKPIVPYHILSPDMMMNSNNNNNNFSQSNSSSLSPSPLPNKTTFESIIINESKCQSPELLFPLQLDSAIDNNNENNNDNNNPNIVPPPFPEMLPSPKIINFTNNNNNNNNNNESNNENENSKRFPKLSVRTTELDESQSLETTSKYCILEKKEKKENDAIISPSSADGYNNNNNIINNNTNNNNEIIKKEFAKESNPEISISEIPASSTEVGNEGEVDALNEFVEKKGKWEILDTNLSTETKL